MKVTIADSNEAKALGLNTMTTNRKMEINDYIESLITSTQYEEYKNQDVIDDLIKIIDELLQELNQKA